MTAQLKILLEWLINKVGHFSTGFTIAFLFTLTLGKLAGLGAGTSAGIGKELYDKYRGYKFDWWDLGADIAGVILGVWIVIKFG